MRVNRLVIVWLAVLIGACAPPSDETGTASTPPPDNERPASRSMSEGQLLREHVEAYFDEYLALNPGYATYLGDHRYDDRLANDIGGAHRAEARALEEKYLREVRALDPKKLRTQDRLSFEIFLRERESALEALEFPSHLLPVNPFRSVPLAFAELASGSGLQPFATPRDYDAFLSRADGFVVWVDQAIANMRAGMEQGVVAPRMLMERSLAQLATLRTPDVSDSLFYRPVTNLPADIAESERSRIESAYTDAVTTRILPACRRLHDFIRGEYLAAARESVGLGALPGGASWYAWLVRRFTIADLSPSQIHEIGLGEVARIREEMERVMSDAGFDGDLDEMFRFLRTNERYFFDEPGALLGASRDLRTRVAESMPPLFSYAPAADFEISPVESFRAASAAAAYFRAASLDGSRPGVLFLNTDDLAARPRYLAEAAVLREALPGRHFQRTIQRELMTLPRFRRVGGDPAYVEGWALYAEMLGQELGVIDDPSQRYGALASELLHAVGLVVDTGLHDAGWTYEEALAYLLGNSALSESAAGTEIGRYIANPGAALAGKIGQLELAKLRERTERALVSVFDPREFHARVLEDGAIPLDVLAAKIDRWIETFL